jgi:hypothetical protein
MPRVMDCPDAAAITLEEASADLALSGFDPRDEDSLGHAALVLRRLGNNRRFLADIMLRELENRHRAAEDTNAYGPQVIALGRAGSDCLLRANLWPGAQDAMMRASSGEAFVYGLPHDHNFSFLTLGYVGPGYWSDFYEVDYEAVDGWRGEPVKLRAMGRGRLEEGRIMLYRAHRDVHVQRPADSLSVSLNILHTGAAQGWLDQYRFDVERGEIAGHLAHGSSEAFLRIAVGTGCAQALDLAETFARRHPSARMRLHALDALASVAVDRDAVWARAERGGSRMVAMEAGRRRKALAEQG